MGVARALFPYLFRRIATSAVESCEFDSLKNYETTYRRLALLLGRDQACVSTGEIEFLFSVEDRGAHPGTIALRDYLFLSAFASIVASERAVEIGTLAGFSAAIIAAALHRPHPEQKGVLVETIDRNTHSVVDSAKPVGFQIPDIIPHFADAVRVHAPADSALIGELATREELQLIFIDADHQHPRPYWICCVQCPMSEEGAGYCCTISNWARWDARGLGLVTTWPRQCPSALNGFLLIGHFERSPAEILVLFKYPHKKPPLSQLR
jgi:hypothetical protein